MGQQALFGVKGGIFKIYKNKILIDLSGTQVIGMKYEELVKGIKNYEDPFWFSEYVYFKALEELKEVRTNLGTLKVEEHMKQIVKVFLIQWGGMGRTADRKNLDWGKLTSNYVTLRLLSRCCSAKAC